MDALKLIITILQLLCGLSIILGRLVPVRQERRLSGAIGGVADSLLAKNKARLWTPSWPAPPSGLALCS